jgi:hypothetical protein
MLVSLTFLLLLLGAGAAWYAISTDRWLWDDRSEPARSVWALNDKLGRFLYEHGQDTPEEIAAARPRREDLTAQEKTEVKKVLESDPRFKDRNFEHAGGFAGGGAGSGGFKLKPALPVGGAIGRGRG